MIRKVQITTALIAAIKSGSIDLSTLLCVFVRVQHEDLTEVVK